MGVAKLAEAAIHAPTTSGRGSMPSVVAIPSVIGTISAMAALFERNSVKVDVMM